MCRGPPDSNSWFRFYDVNIAVFGLATERRILTGSSSDSDIETSNLWCIVVKYLGTRNTKPETQKDEMTCMDTNGGTQYYVNTGNTYGQMERLGKIQRSNRDCNQD